MSLECFLSERPWEELRPNGQMSVMEPGKVTFFGVFEVLSYRTTSNNIEQPLRKPSGTFFMLAYYTSQNLTFGSLSSNLL